MKLIGKKCREIFTLISIKSQSPCSQSVLGKTLLSLLPAMTYGCSISEKDMHSPVHTSEEVSLNITKGGNAGEIATLDILVFRDDELKLLDCYQRIEDTGKWDRNVTSGTGRRIISICANGQLECDEWAWVRSRQTLDKITASLELERRDNPLMSGEAAITMNAERKDITEISIYPLVSEIYLRSICCDFRGKPYSGEKIHDVKVYLTNVNAECGLLEDGMIYPKRIINPGRLCQEDVRLFSETSLIVQEIPQDIGTSWIYPDIRLWCYPGNIEEESPGTPYTRLVIEGKISGKTFYWPVNINREEGGSGIGRNQRYIYDIKITRKGSDDPDRPVNTEDLDISFEIKTWEEKENYLIGF